MTLIFPVAAAAVVAVGIVLLLRSARKFEQRKIEQGEWDKDGPLEPSDPPANFYPTHLTGKRTFDVLTDMRTDEDETAAEPGTNESTQSASPKPPLE